MSNLKTIDRQPFEDLFDMSSGYVLYPHLSNATFQSFFAESVGKDIYSDRYAKYGDSKAKRLRAFWDLESDHLVGKVLTELVDLWEYKNPEATAKDKTLFTESTVEEAVLEWSEALNYSVLHGPDIAPEEPAAERISYSDVILTDRLRAALSRLNPTIPDDALDEAFRKITRTETPSLIENNRRFHRMLVDGIDVEYHADGRIVSDKVWLIDFDHPEQNDWLAVNQFTVTEGKHTRRPDVILFINGLPLVVIELKNPADENATTRKAFQQLQTYKQELPTLLGYNVALVASDGVTARIGTLTADWERFMPWRTVDGETVAPTGIPELEVLLRGVFDQARFLDLLRHFIVFEVDGETTTKKMAGYHQFHAVNRAVECTVEAVSPTGNRRAGVVWHTQGSGKSLTMNFYAGKVILHPKMENPTVVVITDRNDLDDQLFGTFALCHDLLRQKPVQARDRQHLRELLQVSSGGVIFTTLQKFTPEPGEKYPLLTDRWNVIVIADEAHRSQYGLKARVVTPKGKDEAHIAYGFAKHLRDGLPNASFIGFTGTPIEQADRSTPAVFGEYIDIYDIQRAVEDGSTVKILYEGRLAKIELNEDERPKIDPEFEEVTEGEESTVKEKLKSKWARLESMVGSEKRIKLIAQDLVEHWEKRLDAIDGKAMIVGMSRRICVELYKELTALRPDWHSDKDEEGAIKVVMTGSASDPLDWQPHIRSKKAREELAKRFKNPDDPMKLVIVRDMWLTGFDAPCMHTMYVDKPMRGHGLMQAIARVNRVFRDKPGGLIVDYLGLAAELKNALKDYTEQDRDHVGIPTEQAVELLLEKYEIIAGMFHGFDYSAFFAGTPSQRLAVIPAAMDFVLQLEDGKARFLQTVAELSKAYALVSTEDRAIEIREEVAFFQCIRAQIVKIAGTGEGSGAQELDHAVRQIISRAVASDQVIDIFQAAGMTQPNIAILSDEFLAEVRNLPQKNLALEMLRKLLNDEIRARSKKNLVQSRSFAEMLEKSIRAYQNRSIDAAHVIAELVELAQRMRAAHRRGEDLGMNDDELAFYDALEVNDSAVAVLGDEKLRTIAHELVESVRRNVTIDWTVKDSVRAKLRTTVKRILRKYGYPPDKQHGPPKLYCESP
jgi:type I restriction enzyme, R subunit